MCPLDSDFSFKWKRRGWNLWNEMRHHQEDICFNFIQEERASDLLFLIRVKSCTFFGISTRMDGYTWGRYGSLIYLLPCSFYRPCWWKYQGNKSVNSKREGFLVGTGAMIGKSEPSQGHPSLTGGPGGRPTRSKWRSRRQRVKLILNLFQIPMPALWFLSKADISKRTPRGTSWMWKH